MPQGVLVLMLSAGMAAAIALWREQRKALSMYCWIVAAIFAYTLVDNVIERPDGIIIASIFIVMIVIVSGVSRYMRATNARLRGRVLRCRDGRPVERDR